jgi:hypothetical protein
MLASTTAGASVQPTFAAPPLFSVAGREIGMAGFFSMAKGDFNHDGFPDFAVVGFACANGVGDSVAIYLGRGDGTFQPPVYYSAGACPFQVVVGHLRGKDAPEDLIMVDEGFGQLGITVLLGNGDGTFQSPIATTLPSTPTAAVVEDFNGDGKADVAVTLFGGSGQQGGNLQSLAILIGHSDGTFDATVLYKTRNNH